jgi:hypothetical protein
MTFPRPSRYFVMACVPPIAMAVLLSPWFLLLLLLMPLTALGMRAALEWRVRHARCLRCGAPFE